MIIKDQTDNKSIQLNVNIDSMPQVRKQQLCTSNVTAFIFIVNPHELWLGSFLHSHEMDNNVVIASSVCFKEKIYKYCFTLCGK